MFGKAKTWRDIATIRTYIKNIYNMTKILNSERFIFEKMGIQPISKEQLSKGKGLIYKYFPKTRDELIELVKERIDEEGCNCNLNNIDVSVITDMIGIFSKSEFNGDISLWNVSNVTDMTEMFYESDFNGDISKWNVSNLIDMSFMFTDSAFDGNLSSWDVSNVDLHQNCFDGTPLENDKSRQPKFND